MISVRKAAAIASLGATFMFAGTAGAATLCSAVGNNNGLLVSDVTYSVTGAAPFSNASDCYGVVDGNINQNTVISQFGGGWTYADATDEASKQVSLLGSLFTFTLTEDTNAGANQGNYILSATDDNGAASPNFPIGLDFVIGLKGANDHALYFFDNATFDGSGGGAWAIRFNNNGGNFPAVSHIIAFVRNGDQTCCDQDVPEPGSLALFGLGLLGLGLSRRRFLSK